MVDDIKNTLNAKKVTLPYKVQLLLDIKEKYNLPFLDVDSILQFLKSKNSQAEEVRNYIYKEIREKLYSCTDCSLCLSDVHTQKVPGEGSLKSPLVLIGEGPGFDEDKLGRPFVGRAGRLLTTILNKLGVQREKIYITNVIKCRPPRNRTPAQKEIDACIQNLELELFMIKPKVIMALGAIPLNYFKPNSRIMRERGHWIRTPEYWVMPTFHPAYILRQHGKPLVKVKWEVWSDFNKALSKAKELDPEYKFH